jgi:glutathione S-transferase
MEPAFGEKFFKWEDIPRSRAAWGSFADMEKVVTDALAPGPFLLGDEFTAADVLVCANLHLGTVFKLFPEEGAIADYVARCAARPALKRARAIEEGYVRAKEAERA